MPDVKIKGYSGTELPFSDVPKVWLAAPESTPDNPVLVPFTYGEAIEGVEVELDFSDGDMQIAAPDGYLIRSGVVKKPETLEAMRRLAEQLSQGFAHVRVDLYEVNGKNYFGELTFYPGNGMTRFEPEEWDYKMGQWITLPDKTERGN